MKMDPVPDQGVTPNHAWTGSRYIDVTDPRVEDIDPFEIAVGLSREARYGGNATSIFWSVGQHSLLCEKLARECGVTSNARLRTILLHDAPEYMLRDIIRPVKRNLPGYHILEDTWWRVIADRFHLPTIMPHAVKLFDDLACAVEKKTLIHGTCGPWPGLPDVGAHGIPSWLLGLSMDDTARCFMDRLSELQAQW